MFPRRLATIAAVAAGLSLVGVAGAQEGLSTKPDYDLIERSERVEDDARATMRTLRQAGVEALQDSNFSIAEAAFADLLAKGPGPGDANFLMGLAKSGLEKWAEARSHFEIAVRDEPKRPEPRTRLGLVSVQLADIDMARTQRAELARLDGACKGVCDDAAWIANGLAVLDQAIERGHIAAGVGSIAAAATPVSSDLASATDIDPARYSMVTFDDTHDLYALLTQAGRCQVNDKLAEPRQPCALILYMPVNEADDGLAANFKPVFKVVSKNTIWAVHNKKLQKIKIADLYFDEDEIIGEKKRTFVSVALIGNAENRTNCEQGRPCLNGLVAQDMFRMYGNMPDSVVEVIWGAGMKDPGTVRIR